MGGRLTRAVADQAERARALDPGRSFIVQAPAGSGKTDLLIQRYLALLACVAQPEEVLAITFTRKAAGEMRQRVLEALPDAAAIAHRLRIMTIDALCASLTRQMPVLARFGAQPRSVEDADEHYLEAAHRALAALDPPARHFLAHLDNNTAAAADLLAAMLAKRDQWLRRTGAAPTRAELEAALARQRHRLIGEARALEPRASEEFARAVLTREGAWRKRSPEAQALQPNEPLRQALAALLAMPPARYAEGQWAALEAILKLLPLAAAQLKVVFAERGEADFTEIAQGALRALGTAEAPTDLLLALDQRIQHLLVDEFQDTSISQWELLERLTAGWEPGDGRTLFLVGDPMQSIYRFREAEVALFLHAQRAGLGDVALERLELSTNFRSQAGLVSWFNEFFAQVLPASADETLGAVPYAASAPRPGDPGLAGTAATWHALPDRAGEARRVVELVQGARGRTAILVRQRNALAGIVPALKGAGIRFRAIEIEPLGEKQVVQDLYALTRAVSHLGDRIAWLALLRAPWCGLGLDDLSALAEPAVAGDLVWEAMDDPARCAKLSPEGQRRLTGLRAALAPVLANRLRGTLRDRVEGAWHALGGPACVESATELEDAEVFLDALERLEQAGEVEIERLAAALEDLYALPDVNATDDDLQIMTIHKAKGLEFGIVLVPGLDRGPGRGDPPLVLWKEQPGESMLLAPIRPAGLERDPTYDYLNVIERAAEDAEAARLLYVAATRAEDSLHLLGCVKSDPEIKPPPKRSLLGLAWKAVPRLRLEPGASEEVGAPARSDGRLARLAADFRLPTPPDPVRWTSHAGGGGHEAGIEFSWAGETARHIGSVVHRWLQRIAEDHARGWDAQRVESLGERFIRDLERRGVSSAELAAAADSVASALRNALSDERGRWILGPHPEAGCEVRIRVRRGGELLTCVIDRVFRDSGEAPWIVEYKTSRHEGAGLDAFLDREQERYATQLRSYGAALGITRFGLYFPLLRGWREERP